MFGTRLLKGHVTSYLAEEGLYELHFDTQAPEHLPWSQVAALRCVPGYLVGATIHKVCGHQVLSFHRSDVSLQVACPLLLHVSARQSMQKTVQSACYKPFAFPSRFPPKTDSRASPTFSRASSRSTARSTGGTRCSTRTETASGSMAASCYRWSSRRRPGAGQQHSETVGGLGFKCGVGCRVGCMRGSGGDFFCKRLKKGNRCQHKLPSCVPLCC